MTPIEFQEIAKAFGVPGAIGMGMIYIWMTRQNRAPEKSQLEHDIRQIMRELEVLRAQMQDIRERVVRIETKQEGSHR